MRFPGPRPAFWRILAISLFESDYRQPAVDDMSPYLFFIATQSVALSWILAIVGIALQLALHPLYGSVAPALHHKSIKAAIVLLSTFWPYHKFPRLDDSTSLAILASFLACLPYLTYTLGKWLGRATQEPAIGACLTVLIAFLPPMLLGLALLKRWSARVFLSVPSRPLIVNAAITSTVTGLHIATEWLWKYVPFGSLTSSNIFLILTGCLTVWATLVASLSREGQGRPTGKRSSSHLLITLVVPVAISVLGTQVPPIASPSFPYVRQSAPSQTGESASVRVLARQESTTGLILVGEYIEKEFRFLRADHSLLGGRWIGKKVAPDSRSGLGDSIYSTFVLQEAIRLIEPRDKRKEIREKGKERALFIGLGVGIAVESFLTHRINTTVVEIDAAVYTYARNYFGLPEPDRVVLEDAKLWLEKQGAISENEKYDYVVHDCFSGGGVPGHIFTDEFWKKLKSVMKTDGVIAVNFAGKLGSNSARAIYLTLEANFGQCRGYHDHLRGFDEEQTFFNVVVFCSSVPWSFRKAKAEDYSGSYLRKHMLTGVEQREISRARILGNVNLEKDEWILHDGSKNLEMWEEKTALEHWKVMRDVLPDIFWETY